MDMASMVNGVIRKTSEALEENNMKQAHRIQEGDVVINRFERHIEQTCLSLIKRESPIASDLRLITAALKTVSYTHLILSQEYGKQPQQKQQFIYLH